MFENYEKDYIMRQIKMLGQLLARLLLRSDGVKYELPLKAPYSKADELHQALCRLLAEGKINEAENWLYEEVGQLGLPGLRDVQKRLNFQWMRYQKYGFGIWAVKQKSGGGRNWNGKREDPYGC